MGIWLGQRGIDGINKYKWVLDELRLWKKALSQDEMEEVKGLLQRLVTAVKPPEEEES